MFEPYFYLYYRKERETYIETLNLMRLSEFVDPRGLECYATDLNHVVVAISNQTGWK